jgi:hypothetical protein
VSRQPSPGLISSLPGTAALPQFISFSTSYLELGSGVQRATLSNLEKELQPTEGHEADAYAEVKRIKLSVLLNEQEDPLTMHGKDREYESE